LTKTPGVAVYLLGHRREFFVSRRRSRRDL
jgi:hypothetical protein